MKITQDLINEYRQLFVEFEPTNPYVSLSDFCAHYDINKKDIESYYIDDNWEELRDAYQVQFRTTVINTRNAELAEVKLSANTLGSTLLANLEEQVKNNDRLSSLVYEKLFNILEDPDGTVPLRSLIQLHKIAGANYKNINDQLMKLAEMVRQSVRDNLEDEKTTTEETESTMKRLIDELTKYKPVVVSAAYGSSLTEEDRAAAFSKIDE